MYSEIEKKKIKKNIKNIYKLRKDQRQRRRINGKDIKIY